MEGKISFKDKDEALFFMQGLIESFDITREELMDLI